LLAFQVQCDVDRQDQSEAATGCQRIATLWTWIEVEDAREGGDFRIDVTLHADPLTTVMLVAVIFVSLLVSVYLIGYTEDDPHAWRTFTCVSLLVFSMTMLIAAGAGMLGRCIPPYLASAGVQRAVATVGGITALSAAAIAVTQTDLRRILAYATLSQLGYVLLGIGAANLSGFTAVACHLLALVFVMSLLALGTASVLRATGGAADLRRFGGLRRQLPVTRWTFLFGALALAGVFPFAGFWSTGSILAAVEERALAEQPAALYRVLYAAALATAFLTAFYIFRAYFLTFHGRQRIPDSADPRAARLPRSMTVPLIVLAFCVLVSGGYFELVGGLSDFLEHTPSLSRLRFEQDELAGRSVSPHGVALMISAIGLAGAAAAAMLYLVKPASAAWMARAMDTFGLYRLAKSEFYLGPMYRGLLATSLRGLARLCRWIDRHVVDRAVNLCGLVPMLLGAALRPLCDGTIQFYALAAVLGTIVLLGLLWM